MISSQGMRCMEIMNGLKTRQDADPELWTGLLNFLIITLGTTGSTADELLGMLREELGRIWRGGSPPVLSGAAEDRLRDRKKAAVEMLWRAAREDRELAADEVMTLFFLLEEIVAENAKGDIVQEIGQDFYRLTIQERNYARVQVANQEASLAQFRDKLQSAVRTMEEVSSLLQGRLRLERLTEEALASVPQRDSGQPADEAVIEYIRSLEDQVARLETEAARCRGHQMQAQEASGG